MLRSSILCRPSACRENGLSAGACIAPRCMSPGPETSTSKARTKQRAPLLDAFAGAVAGAVSRFAIGPLDVLKIRFQVQIEPLRPPPGSVGTALTSKYTGIKQAALTIFREEGIQVSWPLNGALAAQESSEDTRTHVQGLWRGTVPGLLLTVPYTAVQFFTLQTVRNFAATSGLEQTGYTHLTSFGSGAIAGAAATAASYPFDLLRTTLAAQGEPKVRTSAAEQLDAACRDAEEEEAAQVYRGLIDAAQGIVRQQGVRGLYNGLSITLLEIMPYAALQFGLYDAFVAAHRRRALRQARLGWLCADCCL